MTDHAALAWITILVGTFGTFCLMCHLIINLLPRAIKAIRTWWNNPEPDARSNHR